MNIQRNIILNLKFKMDELGEIKDSENVSKVRMYEHVTLLCQMLIYNSL